MATSTITIKGDKKLLRALKKLEARPVRKETRKALNKAATPMLKAARRNAEFIGDNDTIRDSLGKRVKTFMSGVIVVVMGPRKGHVRDGHDPTKTAHLVEFGTRPHSIGEIKHPGTKAFPFMREAFDETVDQSLRLFIRLIRGGIEKLAKTK